MASQREAPLSLSQVRRPCPTVSAGQTFWAAVCLYRQLSTTLSLVPKRLVWQSFGCATLPCLDFPKQSMNPAWKTSWKRGSPCRGSLGFIHSLCWAESSAAGASPGQAVRRRKTPQVTPTPAAGACCTPQGCQRRSWRGAPTPILGSKRGAR